MFQMSKNKVKTTEVEKVEVERIEVPTVEVPRIDVAIENIERKPWYVQVKEKAVETAGNVCSFVADNWKPFLAGGATAVGVGVAVAVLGKKEQDFIPTETDLELPEQLDNTDLGQTETVELDVSTEEA